MGFECPSRPAYRQRHDYRSLIPGTAIVSATYAGKSASLTWRVFGADEIQQLVPNITILGPGGRVGPGSYGSSDATAVLKDGTRVSVATWVTLSSSDARIATYRMPKSRAWGRDPSQST